MLRILTAPCRLAALAGAGVMVSAAVLGALVAMPVPAHALTPFAVTTATQSVGSGFGGFAGTGSRKVTVEITGAAANQTSSVWYGVRDTSDPTQTWYGGWTDTDIYGNASPTITTIPSSGCGHTFVVDASDWGTAGAPAAPERTFVDNCKPMLGWTFLDTLYGNGFAPGSQVVLKVNTTPPQSITVAASTLQFHFVTGGTFPLLIVTSEPGNVSDRTQFDCATVTVKAYVQNTLLTTLKPTRGCR